MSREFQGNWQQALAYRAFLHYTNRVINSGPAPVYGAVDIGGTKIAVGLVSAAGVVLAAAECPTHAASGPEAAFSRIAELLETAQARTGHRAAAIGVGCTGPVDPVTGTIGDVGLLPGWLNFPLTARLAQSFAVPACLENDCDAAALAEAAYGVGQNCTRFLYVTISTGIGTGFIVDGQVYRGAGGAHPEMGHQVLDPSGPLCYCGASGCWESLASGTAVAEWYSRNAPGCTAEIVFQRAAAGDVLAREAVNRFTKYLSIGLGNLITSFAPDRIALGGGVMASAPAFLQQAVAQAQTSAGLIPRLPDLIRPAALGRQAGLVGAARAAQLFCKLSEGNLCTHI